MQTWTYPATVEDFTADGDGFVIRITDIPGALTGDRTLEETLALAVDCLAVAIRSMLAEGEAIPDPRPAREGEYAIPLEPPTAARLMLVRAMAKQGLTKVALAARMRRDEKVVRRILEGKGASLNLTLEALNAAGVWPALAIAEPLNAESPPAEAGGQVAYSHIREPATVSGGR
jgi:predicted RNase H-like HicB family nuclease